jgi:hypothetical protein
LFPLLLRRFLRRLLILLGRSFGLDAIFSDASVFTLGSGRERAGNACGGEQDESSSAFHNFSEWEMLR